MKRLKLSKNLKKVLLTMFVILLPIVIVAIKHPGKVEAAWYDDSWHYRKKITFGNTGSADTNKKVLIDVDTATLTTDKLQASCADSRFTDVNGNPLPYYLDSAGGACDTGSTDYYVLMPTISKGTNTIYYYYGNPNAGDAGELSQFSESTFTPTSGPTTASEEVAPSPSMHLGMNEGYWDGGQDVITKNEQIINIFDGYWSTSTGGPTDNSLGLIHWDSSKYTGATVYLEAVLYDNYIGGSCSNGDQAQLYTSGGTAVTGSLTSQVCTANSWTRVRSSAFTPTDNTDYTVRITGYGGTTYVRSARLIVVQSGTITDTSTQIEVGAHAVETSSTATQLQDKKLYYYDSDKFDPAPTAYFEATMEASENPKIEQQVNLVNQTYYLSELDHTYYPQDNSLGVFKWDATKYTGATVYFEAIASDSYTGGSCSDTARAALFTTGGTKVASSEVSFCSGSYTRSRSGAVTLTDGTEYTVRYANKYGDGNFLTARLVIIQSDATKITDTKTAIEVGADETAFTNTTYASLSNPKYYMYDQSKFSPVPESNGDIEFHATLKIDSAGDTVYAQLWNKTDGQQVAEVSHTGDTSWTLVTLTNVDGDADWDTSNTDEYEVRIKCSDDDTGGCSGNIANASIMIDQSATSGITDVELIHPEINTLNTDSDTTYTSSSHLYRFNPNLESTQKQFGAASTAYYYEATLKTGAGTGYSRLYNSTTSAAISNSEITTTNTNYERVRSSDFTSSLPSYPTTYQANTLYPELKNSSTNTTSVSGSWLVIQVSSLSTTGGATAYADLYNVTDSTQVSGSEVSTSSTSVTRTRSSAITLTTGKEYVVRLRSGTNGATIYLWNAKIILDQSSGSGVYDVELAQSMITNAAQDTDSTYTDQEYLLYYEPDNYNLSAANSNSAYFEATLNTNSGSNAAYAQLKNDTAGTTVTNSEVSTTSTSYSRQRSGNIMAYLPTSAKNLDTQLKNASSSTTTASNSWLILQNTNTIPNHTYDSSTNNNNGSITGSSWVQQCKYDKCLDFDGTDDHITVSDSASLDFAASDSFTISGWFRHIPQSSGTDVILAKHNSTAGGYKVYMESDGDITCAVDDDSTWTPDDSATSTLATYDDNVWHHFACVKSGTSSLTLYLDGAQVAQDSSIAATGTLANANDLYVGIDGDGTSNPWDGQLDEIKIYSYARSAAQIKRDMLAGTSEGSAALYGVDTSNFLSDSLLGYWKLDESSGNASDSSGNSLTLTNNGTTTYVNGKFGSGSEHVPASSQYLSTATAVNGIKTISFWTNPDSTTNYFVSLRGNAYVTSSSGTITATGFTNPKIYVNGVETSTISADTWQLVTVVDDSGINADSLALGRQNTSYYDGTLDEFRLYSKALSPAEILQLYKWAPGPVGYWPMNEGTGTTTTYDISGSGYNGTMNGTMTSADWVRGVFGTALNLDGTDDNITAGNVLSYSSTQPRSNSAWIRTSSSTAQAIVAKMDDAGTYVGYDFFMDAAGTLASHMIYSWSGNAMKVTGAAVINDGKWHHVAYTYDGSQAPSGFKFYVDGVPDTVSTSSDTFTDGSDITNAHPFTIGARRDSSNNTSAPFAGDIDEVRAYNYVRTQEQIISEMNGGHTVPGSPIGSQIANWRFDEGANTTVHDATANKLDLTQSTSQSWTVNGKFASAWSGSGANWASIADDSNLDFAATDSFSIVGWFNHSTASSAETIIRKYETTGADGGYAIRMESDGDITFAIDDDNSGLTDTVSSTAATYDDSTWHQFVAVKDSNSTIKLYIDKTLVGTTTVTETGTLANDDTFYLGDADGTNNGDEFIGYLDEIAIYGTALTQDQINITYNQTSSAALGATSTNSSNSATWSKNEAYCPPGAGASCTGPVGEWHFDENTGTSTTYDTSGNSNDLSLTSIVQANWVPGKKGSALTFDGAADRLSRTDDADFDFTNTESFTITGWFKHATQSAGIDTIIGKYESSGADGGWVVQMEADGDITCAIYDDSGHDSDSATSTAATYDDSKWHNFTCVKNGTTSLDLYLDGILVAQDTSFAISSTLANNDNLRGAISGDATNDWLGELDEIMIFREAASVEKIAWLYNQGKPIGWWKFDECQGSTAYDSSGNGNNGTITIGATGTYTAPGSCSSGTSTEAWNAGTTGKRGASLGFDGTDDYIDFSADTFLPRGDNKALSVSTWFKNTTLAGTGTLIEQWDVSDENDKSWDILALTDGTVQFRMNDYGSSNEYTCTGVNSYDDNQWHQFTAVYDDATDNLDTYIDGRLECDGTTTYNIGPDNATSHFHVGAKKNGASWQSFYLGLLDDVKIWNYALTADQIKTEYNQGAVNFE